MDDNDIIKQENIEQKPNKEIEYVQLETVKLPDYSYGNGNTTLDYKVAIRNKPTWFWTNPLLLIGM